MPVEENEMQVPVKLYIDHEKRIGIIEGEIPLLKNKMTNYEQMAQMMVSSMEKLEKTVLSGHAEQMKFLQDVVKHDQGLESVKLEFEQKMASMKVEQEAAAVEIERKREEAEREQRIETKRAAWKVMGKFSAFFAPTITIIVVLINEWIQSFL